MAMKTAKRAVGAVALSLAMFLLAGIGLFRTIRSGPPPAEATRRAASALADSPALESGSLAQTIAALQQHLRAVPTDWRSLSELGLAYVQEARITADPTYYPKAQGVLQRSLQQNSKDNVDALTGMGALAAARHDFAGALAWGQRAVAMDPYSANAFAVVGDAQIELGRYRDAFATFQKMIDLKPELPTYARVSYAWELQGNVTNAIRAMNLALSAAGTAADASWARNQLGDLYFNSGRLDRAETSYRQAVAQDPAFIPPHAGLAKVEAARGEVGRAIKEYRWVVDRFPLPEYVIALGDLDTITGRADLAAQQFSVLHVEERLFQANGVNMDLEIALFDADHGVDVASGLAAARTEWGRRQAINVADALAWALHANGEDREALTYANRALALGTRNALYFFHRGMIERSLGSRAAARRDLATALSINPHFSILWSKPAASILARLGGRP